MENKKSKWIIFNKINFKNILLYASVLLVSVAIADNLVRTTDEDVFITSIALTILIIFVWRRVSKKYL